MESQLELIKLVWGGDDSSYPAGSSCTGWFGFLHRVKATICILLGLECPLRWIETIPVYVGQIYVGQSWDGPTCDWQEIGVGFGWRNWYYAVYSNGI